MNKKFTKLIAAFALLVFMMPSLAGWGQAKTAFLTSDFTWPDPIKTENFNSLTATSGSGNNNSVTTITNLSGYGIFNKIYVGKNANTTYAIVNDNTFGSKVYRLTSASSQYIIASVTNPSISFGNCGAFSVKISKNDIGYFGIYSADEATLNTKANSSVYFQANNGALSIQSGDGWQTIGTYTTNTIEVCVLYNNTNESTTYGGTITLASKKCHVYVNGSCIMDGETPKDFTIPGATLGYFRFCTNPTKDVTKTMTLDDVNIYGALPTAPVAIVTPPTISPNGGTFHGTQEVTITADDGCYIFYTLDGSDPIEDPNYTAEYYEEPFSITSTKTVKAYAFDNEYNTSSVTTAVFTQEATATPTFSIAGGYYITAQSVEISCTTAGAEILYTTDGSDPIESLTAEIYDGPIAIDATTTVKAIAQATGYDFSEVATATYTILNPADATTLTTAKTAYLNDNTQTAAFINLANVEVVGQTSNYLFLQDANVGILVFGSGAPTFAKGDKFTSGYLAGTFATYGANTEITGFAFINTEKTSGNDLTVTSATIESVLGNWTNYEDRCVSISGSYINTDWILNDGNDHTLTFYDNVYSTGYTSKTAPETTDAFTVKGLLTSYTSGNPATTTYRICPTALTDISTTAKAAAPTFNPVGGATASEAAEATSMTLTPATNTSSVYTKNAGDPVAITAATEISVEPTGTTVVAAYGVRDFYANSNTTTYYYTYPSTSVAVMFNANGTTIATVPVESGENLTAAMAPSVNAPDGFAFVGWSNSESSTTLVEFPIENVTSAFTLYAVYRKIISVTYDKISSLSALVSGEYVITATYGGNTYAIQNKEISSNPKSDTLTISGTTIASGINSSTWLFAVFSSSSERDSVVIQSTANTNLYLNSIDDSKGIKVNDTDTDKWIITYSNSSFKMKSKNGGGRFLAFYSDKCDWRNYNTGSNIQLYKKSIVLDDARYTRIIEIADARTQPGIPATCKVYVKENGVLTLTGTNDGTPANLVIEDGGQLITGNEVAATVQKSIEAYSDATGLGNTDGWYFIASPINGSTLTPNDVNNMLTTESAAPYSYDLYRFNQAAVKEWENYHRYSGFTLANGQGYLYANANDVTLEFAGNIKPYSSTSNTVTLAQTGWNLIGNPFTCKVGVNVAFNELNNGSSVVAKGANSTIMPCAGILVYGDEGTTVTFTGVNTGELATNNTINSSSVQMTLTQQVATRGEYNTNTLDNAIVSFNEGSQLPKFYFGTQNANLYIPQGTEEYAIACSNGQGEMPVNFRANENGTYTLTVNTENVETNYLHLIDNMTGANIDLLQTPSYSFEAKTTDYESRFRLVFASNDASTGSASDETFAFISNGNIIVNGEGTLQVIDVTGRLLLTREVNSSLNTPHSSLTPGVYVMRLINGDNVRTQKIVIE